MPTFDQLILSDIHLYAKKEDIHTHNDVLPECLAWMEQQGYRFRKIILLGDIFEDWYIDASAAIKEDPTILYNFLKQIDRLGEVQEHTPKIFVKGNHDSVSPLMRLDPVVYKFLTIYGYEITERYEERGVVYVHGHQGSISKVEWFFQMLGAKVWYYICSIFRSPSLYVWGFSFVEKKASYRSADPEVRKTFYEDLIRRVKPGDNAIVFGHTHVPIIDEKLRIVNTGDWMDNQTFVIRDDNTLILNSYVSEGNLIELGKLVLK